MFLLGVKNNTSGKHMTNTFIFKVSSLTSTSPVPIRQEGHRFFSCFRSEEREAQRRGGTASRSHCLTAGDVAQ
jgi:hypothetical protein